jgi:hypothetical protein
VGADVPRCAEPRPQGRVRYRWLRPGRSSRLTCPTAGEPSRMAVAMPIRRRAPCFTAGRGLEGPPAPPSGGTTWDRR